MKAWMIVITLIVLGVIGAWAGYWIGHVVGWTTDAEFPLRIGGGDRAIGLSMLLSFGAVVAGAGWLVARPLRRTRHLVDEGAPGHATVLRFWRTGLTASGAEGKRHQVAFDLEMHPGDGTDYPAKALGMLDEAAESALAPGGEVAVRYDPGHPRSVAVVGPMAAAAR
jgi:hypothetical protein